MFYREILPAHLDSGLDQPCPGNVWISWIERGNQRISLSQSQLSPHIYRLPCTPITYCHHLCPSMRQMRHDHWPYFCLASQYPAASPGTATDFAPYLALSASPLKKVMVTRNTTLIHSLEHFLMGSPRRSLPSIESLHKTGLGVKVSEKKASAEPHGLHAVNTWWDGFDQSIVICWNHCRKEQRGQRPLRDPLPRAHPWNWQGETMRWRFHRI